MTGGWRSGRERKFHACPAGVRPSPARGAGSHPGCRRARPRRHRRSPFAGTSFALSWDPSCWNFLALAPGCSFACGFSLGSRWPLSDNEVHEPARYVDALAELFAFQVRSTPGARQCQLSGRLFRDICRGIDTVAQLAVDLDYERYLRGLDQGPSYPGHACSCTGVPPPSRPTSSAWCGANGLRVP